MHDEYKDVDNSRKAELPTNSEIEDTGCRNFFLELFQKLTELEDETSPLGLELFKRLADALNDPNFEVDPSVYINTNVCSFLLDKLSGPSFGIHRSILLCLRAISRVEQIASNLIDLEFYNYLIEYIKNPDNSDSMVHIALDILINLIQTMDDTQVCCLPILGFEELENANILIDYFYNIVLFHPDFDCFQEICKFISDFMHFSDESDVITIAKIFEERIKHTPSDVVFLMEHEEEDEILLSRYINNVDNEEALSIIFKALAYGFDNKVDMPDLYVTIIDSDIIQKAFYMFFNSENEEYRVNGIKFIHYCVADRNIVEETIKLISIDDFAKMVDFLPQVPFYCISSIVSILNACIHYNGFEFAKIGFERNLIPNLLPIVEQSELAATLVCRIFMEMFVLFQNNGIENQIVEQVQSTEINDLIDDSLDFDDADYEIIMNFRKLFNFINEDD